MGVVVHCVHCGCDRVHHAAYHVFKERLLSASTVQEKELFSSLTKKYEKTWPKLTDDHECEPNLEELEQSKKLETFKLDPDFDDCPF
jgi:hypothetical protein